ncbi:YcxB family protein [Actinosynnema sp. NPDC053489]|uniref:YcxB family protein n=1 Tax=Actinosynnema sp. NPDC053489 TaxID=3363916 RepID=UPI0037C9A59B
MELSIRVPYEEQRLRRMVEFVLRRPVRKLRIAGALMTACGVLLPLTGTGWFLPAVLVALGLVYLFAMRPYLLWQSMRSQHDATRQDYRLTLDEAGFAMEGETYEQRIAWSTLQRVEEEPDAWFLVLGKQQALAVYKDLMTDDQRAAFAELLSHRQPA